MGLPLSVTVFKALIPSSFQSLLRLCVYKSYLESFRERASSGLCNLVEPG